jgi:L-erythro-3,5-diaminohexanoate dehydrogenase
MDVCGAPALTRRVVEGCRAGLGESSRPQSFGTPAGISPAPPAPQSNGASTQAVRTTPPSSQAAAITPHAGADEEALPPSADNSKKRSAPVVAVIGAAGKSGSLSAAAAREAGAARVIGIVPTEAEASLLRGASGLVDDVVIADARQSLLLAEAVEKAGGPADVTVVCVDVGGCEGGAILATKQGGTVIFFSMATNFSAAALGAEGVAADVTMLVGNGYVPGHADYALELIRRNKAVHSLFSRRPTPR